MKKKKVDMAELLAKNPKKYWQIREAQYKASKKKPKKVVKKKTAQQKPKPKKVNIENPTGWFVSKAWNKNEPSVAELRIRTFLNTYDFEFHSEVSFNGLLSNKGVHLRVDFWIPSMNVVIEYDGQYYHNSKISKERDKIKNKFCKKHEINLYRFNKDHWRNLEEEIASILALYRNNKAQ